MDTLEQLQKQLEDTRSINLRLFEEIREKNDREKIRVKKLEDSHNVSIVLCVELIDILRRRPLCGTQHDDALETDV